MKTRNPYVPYYSFGHGWFYDLPRDHSGPSWRRNRFAGAQAIGPFHNEEDAREDAHLSRIRNVYGSSFEMRIR